MKQIYLRNPFVQESTKTPCVDAGSMSCASCFRCCIKCHQHSCTGTMTSDFSACSSLAPDFLSTVMRNQVNDGSDDTEPVGNLLRQLIYVHHITRKVDRIGTAVLAYSKISSHEDAAGTFTVRYPSVTAANVSTHLWAIRIVCLKEIDKLNATFGRIVEA